MRQAGAVAGVRFGIEEVTEESSIHSLPVSGAKVEKKGESGKGESGKGEGIKMEGKDTESNDISGIPEGADLFGFDSRTPAEGRTENPNTPSPIPQIGMISDLVFFAAPLDR